MNENNVEYSDTQWLEKIQNEHAEWQLKNFGKVDWFVPMTGITEEVGELAHSLLKQYQQIRGTSEEHDEKAKDAVGDITIYIIALCNLKGWNLKDIIEMTWGQIVSKRDWKKDSNNGSLESP